MIDLFALITFWTFVVAAYAIFPPVVRARVKLFVSWQFTAAIFILTSLLGLLSTTSALFCGNPNFCKSYESFSSPIVYIILSIYSLIALWEIQKGSVNRKNIFRFKSSAEILYRKGLTVKGDPEGWGVLIDILYDNLENIFKMASAYELHRKLWYQFWIKFIMPKDKFVFIISEKEEKTKSKHKKSKIIMKLEEISDSIRRKIFAIATRGKVNTFYPNVPYSSSSLSAQSIIDLYVLDKKLLELSVIYKPDFSLRLLSVSKKYKHKVDDITDAVLQKLLENTESYLYENLVETNVPDNAKSTTYQDRKFLTIFFSRDRYVDDSHICAPILRYVGKHLEDLHRAKDDPYNLPHFDFYDGTRYKNPILGGLLLYDWVVRTALINDIEWHMFLQDIEHWEEDIIKNMTFDASGWAGKREFPSQYFYFLYEIFDKFTGWITFVENNEDIAIKPLKGMVEKNGNALQFIIETLPGLLRHVANSDIPDHRKAYLADMVWRAYYDLQGAKRKELHDYGKLLLEELFIELTRYDRPFDDKLFKLLISSAYKFDVAGVHTSGAFKESDNLKARFKKILIEDIVSRLPIYDIAELETEVKRLFATGAYVESDGINIPSYFRFEKILFKDIGLPATLSAS